MTINFKSDASKNNISSVISGIEALSSGMSKTTGSYAEEAEAEINADITRKAGATAFEISKRNSDMKTGEIINRAGSSGLQMSGSVLDAIAASQRMGIQDAFNTKLKYETEANNLDAQASAARSSRSSGMGTALISSVAAFQKAGGWK